MGISGAQRQQAPDPASRLEGCQEGCKGFPTSSECRAALRQKGLRSRAFEGVRRYRASETSAEPQQRSCHHDLRHGGFAAEKQKAPPSKTGAAEGLGVDKTGGLVYHNAAQAGEEGKPSPNETKQLFCGPHGPVCVSETATDSRL